MANKIVINGQEISDTSILNGKIESSHSMVGESLAADQFTFEISTNDEPFIAADQDHALITADHELYFAKNPIDVSEFKDGDEILCYSGETLLGKYFFDEVVQSGANRHRITALSIIGRLLNSKHYGGIYTQVPASQIFNDILNGLNFTVDPDVGAATVTGYLPIALRRDNLQQLLLATGSTIKVYEEGIVCIEPMSAVSTGTFDANRCYSKGTLTTGKPVTGVKLTEHNYSPAGNTVTLFSDGLDGEELIEFKEPYHSLSIEGGTIVESGANYARISAKGAVLLTGQPYTHVTRIVTAGTIENSGSENVKSITDCYLANPQVAQALVERFFAFFQCTRTIAQDVLVENERAGDVVSVINPYTDALETATIKRFTINMSTVNKANAEFLVGFVPQGTLSGFKNHVMLTDSGRWTVPEGITKIRIILVGAGSGGSGGSRGSAGGDSTDAPAVGEGGSGGSAGKAGSGGRVFEISLDVTPGQVFIFSCGIGGINGVGQTADVQATEGAAGTPTIFGGYSSDYGRLYPYGYFEAKTGMTFAASGAEGFAGGRGGRGNDQVWDGENRGKAEDGESVNGYSGGLGASYRSDEHSERSSDDYYGGGGAGAANGAAGGNAPGYDYGTYSSKGGPGATGVPGANATNYGQGGGAGNGGGGGGGAGIVYHWDPLFDNSKYRTASGGEPGNGSDGGSGAAGAIVIYY